MNYDFNTLIDRSEAGSSKWNQMKRLNPNTPPNTVPFSVADMELKNPPEIISGLTDYIQNSILGYGDTTDAYYEAVCTFMKRHHNWDIKREWINQYPGVVPALNDIVNVMTKANDGIIVMPPVYYPFYNVINKNERKIVKNPLLYKDKKYTIDFDGLERLAKCDNNKMLILCNPHNPVGRVWTVDELQTVGRICTDNGVVIVSDDIHFDIIMPNYKHTVISTISDDIAENTIVCTAPSKTFNLAGLQASNIIIQGKHIRDKFDKNHEVSIYLSLNLIGLKACELAYTRCDEWLRQMLSHINSNKQVLTEFFRDNMPEVDVIELEGTYLQWLDMRSLGMDYTELDDFMVNKAFMFFDEGHIFGEEGRGFERMNIACPTDVLVKGLDRLAKTYRQLTSIA